MRRAEVRLSSYRMRVEISCSKKPLVFSENTVHTHIPEFTGKWILIICFTLKWPQICINGICRILDFQYLSVVHREPGSVSWIGQAYSQMSHLAQPSSRSKHSKCWNVRSFAAPMPHSSLNGNGNAENVFMTSLQPSKLVGPSDSVVVDGFTMWECIFDMTSCYAV